MKCNESAIKNVVVNKPEGVYMLFSFSLTTGLLPFFNKAWVSIALLSFPEYFLRNRITYIKTVHVNEWALSIGGFHSASPRSASVETQSISRTPLRSLTVPSQYTTILTLQIILTLHFELPITYAQWWSQIRWLFLEPLRQIRSFTYLP